MLQRETAGPHSGTERFILCSFILIMDIASFQLSLQDWLLGLYTFSIIDLSATIPYQRTLLKNIHHLPQYQYNQTYSLIYGKQLAYHEWWKCIQDPFGIWLVEYFNERILSNIIGLHNSESVFFNHGVIIFHFSHIAYLNSHYRYNRTY